MRLVDYLDKGASLGPEAPCLTTDGHTLTYAEVRDTSRRVADALARCGVAPGQSVAILSANDPTSFTCVFGISRAGAVWCPINPRNEAAENRELLDLFDCTALLFQESFAPLVAAIAPDLPKLAILVCLDGEMVEGALTWEQFLDEARPSTGCRRTRPTPSPRAGSTDLAMIVGTGGTTGRPKGVMLTNANLETMTALTLMGYPFRGRPTYLALAPLTHAAGVLCFPVLALGGEIVIMRAPDVGRLPGARRAAPGDAHVPAADADLHGPRPRGAGHDGPQLAAVLLVRRRPDVGGPARGGAHPDRAGDGAAVRADRGADDDLDDAAGRPRRRRRLTAARTALLGRPAGPAGAGGRPRRATAARSPAGSAARSACAGRW